MVKASTSLRSSPPFASLSLASTCLKPCKPSPFLSSFLKRPPFVHSQPMDVPPSSPSSSDDLSAMDNISLPRTDRQRNSKSSDNPSSSREDSPSMTEQPISSMCSRQRLQQYRIQMSGKVIIPDTWGREQQLQELVRYGVVEDALRPSGLMTARTALVTECQHREKKPVRTVPPMSADVEVS